MEKNSNGPSNPTERLQGILNGDEPIDEAVLTPDASGEILPRAEDFEVGDFFYNLQREPNVSLCEVIKIFRNKIEYCDCKFLAELFYPDEREMYRVKRIGPKVDFKDIAIVPITEAWFKSNPGIFAPSDYIKPPTKDDNPDMPSFSMRMIWEYSFKARNWPQRYHVVGFKVKYFDCNTYEQLRREGVSRFWSEKQCQGSAVIAQIVVPPQGENTKAVGVVQCTKINDVIHFLHLCGIYDEINVPKSLL